MSFDDGPQFVDLGDYPINFADERWYAERELQRKAYRNGDGPRPDSDTLRFVTLAEFIAETEETAEAFIGSVEETILPADGILLMYGDGGAGKTTLTIDAVFHMAEGRNWIGLDVDRPVRSLIVENEGPRSNFRKRLDARSSSSSGSDSVFVLSDPWSKVTLGKPLHRAQIAAAANELALDVIVLGPLTTLGMVGGGTPDEVLAFEKLLGELRERIERPVAFWIVHHENKSGDVSGAWERVPDTLLHVQAAGNGHTRVVFRKARWSSEYHGRTLALTWEDGRTFTVVEDRVRDLYEETLEAFRHADAWRTSKEVSALVHCRPGEAKSVLAELTRRGDLMFEIGPSGRSARAQCWRLRSATILSLVPDTPPAPRPDDGFDF